MTLTGPALLRPGAPRSAATSGSDDDTAARALLTGWGGTVPTSARLLHPGAVDDVRQEHIRDMRHLPEFLRMEMQHFLSTYKALEPNKQVVGADCWAPRRDAEAVVEASRERLAGAS